MITQITTGSGRQDLPGSAGPLDVAYVDTPLAPAGGFGFPRLAVRPLGGGAPDILWSNQVEPGRFVIGRPASRPTAPASPSASPRPRASARPT